MTAHAPGQVLIRAVCGGREAEVPLSVGPERITGVLVLPRALRLGRGERVTLQALALTARGRTLAGYPVEWATTDPSIVQIGGDGTVLARAEGHARIVAAIEGWKGVVPVEVRPTL